MSTSPTTYGHTIFDFNRLRRAGAESAVFNVFLLLLNLFGGEE
jgi:hypothetical protein